MNVKVINMPILLEQMRAAGLDAAVVASPDNFFYVSGVKIQTQTLIRDRLALGIVTADGDALLVVCKNEEEQTRRYSWVKDISSYAEFAETPMQGVAAALQAKGLAKARIGLEKRFIGASYCEDLQARLPGASFDACDVAFDRARMIKTEPEIEALRLAAQGTDQAILNALSGARPGHQEHQLARVMADSLFEIGKGEFRDVTWGVASGPNILTTHYWAGERVLEQGDMVRINVRSALRGYFSHLYRIAVVGQPNARQLEWFQKIHDIHFNCVDRLRPGARASDLYHAARKDMDAAGVTYKGSHVGHSTGIALHENPRLQPLDDTVLEAGMVIANEPIIVDPGYCVYHIEDLVLVTDKGPVLLSDRTNTTAPFVIQ